MRQSQSLLLLLLILIALAGSAQAQEYLPEAEFVGSTEFRAASYIQPLWKHLSLEAHYYGVSRADLGIAGPSFEFRIKGHLKIAPGIGVGFGSPFRTSPVAMLRVGFEKDWLFAEYNFIASLRAAQLENQLEEVPPGEELIRYARLSDGDHVSYRWKRLQAGFSWEHISVRAESEWKTGFRVAVGLTRRLSFVSYTLFPEAEFRAGLRFTPEE